MKLFLPLSTALVLFIFSSCKKENNNASIGFQLKTVNRTAQVVGRVSSASITWTSGHAFADKVEFEAEKDDSLEISFEGRVRRKIDLFSSVPQQLTNISLPPGKYDEIEVEIDIANTISDTALVLRGVYNNNGQNVPVLFFVNELVEIEAEAENVEINDNNDFQALTTFNLSQLTSGISGATLNAANLTNGVLIISKESNKAIYDKMIDNLDDMDDVDIDD